jgi:hypothetical protein
LSFISRILFKHKAISEAQDVSAIFFHSLKVKLIFTHALGQVLGSGPSGHAILFSISTEQINAGRSVSCLSPS